MSERGFTEFPTHATLPRSIDRLVPNPFGSRSLDFLALADRALPLVKETDYAIPQWGVRSVDSENLPPD